MSEEAAVATVAATIDNTPVVAVLATAEFSLPASVDSAAASNQINQITNNIENEKTPASEQEQVKETLPVPSSPVPAVLPVASATFAPSPASSASTDKTTTTTTILPDNPTHQAAPAPPPSAAPEAPVVPSISIASRVSSTVDAVTPLRVLDLLYSPGLAVLDEAGALEQCGEWAFLAELLNDILGESEGVLAALSTAISAGSHTKFRESGHALKGTALNLRLPALADVAKKAELLGKQLEVFAQPQNAALAVLHQSIIVDLSSYRQDLVKALMSEYGRLRALMPHVEEEARKELEEGGEEM